MNSDIKPNAMKTLTLKEIATSLRGNLVGDPDTEIKGINGIIEAEEGDISFLANPKYKDHLPLSRASAVLVGLDVEVAGVNLIQIKNPRLAYSQVIGLLFPPKVEIPNISDQAYIAETATIGEEVTIYPGVYVGDNAVVGRKTVIYPNTYIGEGVEIGEECLFHANVSINANCRIGDRVMINAGCVIGSEGFGYEREKDGDPHRKIPHVGNVIIESDVEIGALCAIDRGSVKDTVIRKGTKFDNLVHVAHNCQVGENNLLMAQVCLAGSVKTGQNVWISGQAGVLDHLKIADHAKVFGKSGVTQNIEEPGIYAGFPARSLLDW